MMYVQQSLGADEEIVRVGYFHWMYTLKAVLCIFWGLFFCIALLVAGIYIQGHFLAMPVTGNWLEMVRALHPGFRILAFLIFVFGVLQFAQMMVIRISTEIAVTTNRLIYKRGLVARYVGEMNIDRIESMAVLQTIFGRIFGYGRLMVRGMGVGELILPPIADPIAFRRAIETARSS
jgi:uncharacterized membrane protein YdbT with pleckstrin-like domain